MSPRLTVSLDELESKWSLEDAARAHQALDIADDLDILLDLSRS